MKEGYPGEFAALRVSLRQREQAQIREALAFVEMHQTLREIQALPEVPR